jgi:hypothetical protein
VALALLFHGTCSGKSIVFDNIIAFGDSLTDVGNVAGVTEPNVAPRINGYYQETHFLL